MSSLDLYAKIEPLIGFYEAYETLYERYLKLLKPLHVKTILDIGCGNGVFLKHLSEEGYEAFGVDRSVQMVKRACELGVNARAQELCEVSQNFDVACAVADVLNYILPEELDDFFSQVGQRVRKNGYFLADINSQYGFEEVAQGVMCHNSSENFLCIDANYEKKILKTDITFFEQEGSLYRKEEGTILQYFHDTSVFKKTPHFKLIKTIPFSLFSQKADKIILVMQKI
ncbi:MAG: class I SAM-dependent methyltransferase [Sulfurospirillaceae bacterium]|nr:class I SAM-dependent methyltransferase [Sulfurospirillaceae bacterium]